MLMNAVLISFRLLLLSRGTGWGGNRQGQTSSLASSNPNLPDAFQRRRGAILGVTALLPLFKHGEGVVTGDKCGNLQIELIGADGEPHPINANFYSAINGVTSRPVPIFCAESAGSENYLFTGAGDRYLSVWEKEDKDWIRIEKLGPHTGWVRDVIYNERTERLHSIGCNCIETWCKSDFGLWVHWKKSKIESSPSDGATLSSDLLCLCAFLDSYFIAGGVDGRLHLWNSESMGSPLCSFQAHDGRVNAVVCSTRSGLVYSAGHDGKIQCWKCVAKESRLERIGAFNLGQPRVTSLWTVDLGADDDFLFCATNEGEVFLLRMAAARASWELINTFQLAQRPTIHCLCVDSQDQPNLWIGHSKGLSAYPIASFANLDALTSSKA